MGTFPALFRDGRNILTEGFYFLLPMTYYHRSGSGAVNLVLIHRVSIARINLRTGARLLTSVKLDCDCVVH
jgi:hypothetical protein